MPAGQARGALGLAGLLLGALLWSSATLRAPYVGTPPAPPTSPTVPPSATGWAPLDREPDGWPVRWNPCAPIRFVINPAGSADPRFQVTTLEAARRVSGASGIALVFDGTTDRTAAGWLSERHPSSGPRVLVAWAGDPEAIGAGARTVVGTASTAEDDNRDGQLVYVAGLIRLASWHDLPPEEWLAVQMHEWGHTLGLAHASDPRSVMYPEVGTTEWSAGDRAGLRAVGRASGCLLDANP